MANPGFIGWKPSLHGKYLKKKMRENRLKLGSKSSWEPLRSKNYGSAAPEYVLLPENGQ
jgi:hypothetical protein